MTKREIPVSDDKDQTVSVVLGDITELAVDAIVNSANRSLLGGGGVDRAIHSKAGRDLVMACGRFEGCPVGEARLTPGFALPAKFVIHAVGPVWLGGGMHEIETLRSAYWAALDIAHLENLRCVAFPCISRGIHRFPADIAAQTAVSAVVTHAYRGDVIFCCATEEDRDAYLQILSARFAPQGDRMKVTPC